MIEGSSTITIPGELNSFIQIASHLLMLMPLSQLSIKYAVESHCIQDILRLTMIQLA